MLNLGEIDTDVLFITKSKLGLTYIEEDSAVRFAIVAARQELTNTYGLTIDQTRADHVNILTDMAVYNYQIKDDKGALPRHLEFRINNLMFGEYYE